MRLPFFVLLFLGIYFIPVQVDARSGCCSHHGGVCGCGCCDGSSLSVTCAPYYPSCNSESVKAVPVQKLKPLPEKATAPSQSATVNTKTSPVPSQKIVPVNESLVEEDDSFGMGTILSLLGAGALGWYFKGKQ
jgi:hypothetical protein